MSSIPNDPSLSTKRTVSLKAVLLVLIFLFIAVAGLTYVK